MKRTTLKSPRPKKASAKGQLDPAVTALLRDLEHPLAREIEAVRRTLLSIDPAIDEAVKWNTASYRTSDFFAAVNLRSTAKLQLVFHTGAKQKATAKTGIRIDDPAGLCEWLARDRCLVTLGVGAEIRSRRAAFEALVREWIRWV
jgi:hypothetical protein